MIILCGTINMKETLKGNAPWSLSFWCAFIGTILCFVEFFGLIIFFRRNQSKLHQEKYLKKCGYTYEALNFRIRGGWALVYPVLYQFRFIVMVFAIMFINEYTVYSMLLINIITIFVMNLLGSKHPLTPIKENYIAIFNEFVIIVMMNLMLITSLPTITVERKKGLGWSMVYILGISIAIS